MPDGSPSRSMRGCHTTLRLSLRLGHRGMIPHHACRGACLRSHGLGLHLRGGRRALHTPLPLPWSQDESLLEQPETGAAKHLALEQFQACDMPLHGSVAPGQGETGLDGGIIVSEPLSKPVQGYNGTLRDLGQPGIQVRALPLTHEAGKGLRQRDRLSHVGMLRTQLPAFSAKYPPVHARERGRKSFSGAGLRRDGGVRSAR